MVSLWSQSPSLLSSHPARFTNTLRNRVATDQQEVCREGYDPPTNSRISLVSWTWGSKLP